MIGERGFESYWKSLVCVRGRHRGNITVELDGIGKKIYDELIRNDISLLP
jgi:hypothetical protein